MAIGKVDVDRLLWQVYEDHAAFWLSQQVPNQPSPLGGWVETGRIHNSISMEWQPEYPPEMCVGEGL